MSPTTFKRFPGIKPAGRGLTLGRDHHAVVNGETIFPTTVNSVDQSRVLRLLKSGHNSRKIGKCITKGRWRGLPLFTLTLEERKTCPRACSQWRSCYGNRMPYAQRLVHGAEFERRLWGELEDKQWRHRAGFAVRLHVLGDFYSADYAALWHDALDEFPGLHLFGFTAHAPDSDIGVELRMMNARADSRAWFRFSGAGEDGEAARVIARIEDSEHVVCPAQLDMTAGCGTCGLCWTMDRPVEFLQH